MRITVVGGGTAGWITALLVRQLLPQAQITLVESREIGILGAGEGTTPHFVELFLAAVGIPVGEVVKHAGATLKNSIRFVDWRGDGGAYDHPFEDDITPGVDLSLVHPDEPVENAKISFSAYLSARNRVLLSHASGDSDPADGLGGLTNHGKWAMHFDAVRLASFLKGVALRRGITHIEGLVSGVREREDGGIRSLDLQDGRTVGGDLFFDCTGFRRLLIGGHYNVPLVDVSESLPVDRAIPFSLPMQGRVPPYTEAIAMPAGWAWKIPVEGRFGCGYVYDSAFATEDQARAQVRSRFGADVDMPKVLAFKAGYYERVWVHNCVALGLASAFLEPLEATSIGTTIVCLRELLRAFLPLGDQAARDDFNAFHRRLHGHTVDFLYAHYLGGRRDTPFWSSFRDRTRPPPVSARIVERGGYRWPVADDPMTGLYPQPFPVLNWIWVTRGLGVMDPASIERYWRFYGLHDGYEQRIRERTSNLRRMGRGCLEHEEMLARLRSR